MNCTVRVAVFLWTASWLLTGPSCIGTPVGSEAESLALVETIPATTWQNVVAGCEEQLSDNVSFAAAAGAPALLVTIDQEGLPVCVDSHEAIEDELDELELAHPDLAFRLRVRFLLALGHAETLSMERGNDLAEEDHSASVSNPAVVSPDVPRIAVVEEPEPQPSEPEPQPSSDSVAEEPEPQPSTSGNSNDTNNSQSRTGSTTSSVPPSGSSPSTPPPSTGGGEPPSNDR